MQVPSVPNKAPQSRGMSAMLRRLAARRMTSTLAAGAMLFSVGHAAQAASATFSGTPADQNIGNAANYVGGAAPGNTTTTSNDVLTFNAPINTGSNIGSSNFPITIDTGRTLGGITFDTANAGAYTVGVVGGTTLNFTALTAGTNITQVTSTVTNAETIAAPIFLKNGSGSANPFYTFRNNAASAAATLSLTGTLTANSSSSRPTFLVFDGSNTGNNIVSGNLLDPAASQGGALLTKNGLGTWILSGTNVFSGTAATSSNTAYGVQINAGTLVAANNAALGTVSVNNYINNGGTLQLANNPTTGSITLDNGLTLTLNNGGTISSKGSNTTNSIIRLSTAAATSANLSTVSAGDIFTVGNGANDLTGGATDTVLHIGGPGTIALGQASNYVGTITVDSGALRASSVTALGTNPNLSFGAASTGKLQVYGVNVTTTGLNTNSASPGTATIENGSPTAAILTVNNPTVASTFAGIVQDGGAGTLGLTKNGAGKLTLTGANTYTGGTIISGGTLSANNVSGSATGTGTVNVNSGGTLAGTGTAGGSVTVASSGTITPGLAGTGTLNVGSLTLSSGSGLNFNFDSPSAASLGLIAVSNTGTLTINGGQLNINGGSAFFTTPGTYNLISYSGSIAGAGVSALTLNSSNKDSANALYSFAANNGLVTLTIAASTVPVNYYKVDADGNWSDPNVWSTGVVPNTAAASAAFGGGTGITQITADRTVTVDGSYIIGTLLFNNPTRSFTLAAGTGANLTLDNSASTSFVTDTAGNHTVQAPITLTANGATFSVSQATDKMTVSGVVGSTGTSTGLTKTGSGTLALTGINTYLGGTTLSGGTIQINSASSLGDVSGNLTFGGGTLQLLTDVTTPRNYIVGNNNDAIIDTNNHALVLNGTVVPSGAATGGLTKNGLGVLTLAPTAANTYNGNTTINGGTLSVAADTSLGAVPAAASAGNIVINNAILDTSANVILNANRGITLGSANSTINVEAGTFLTYAGVMNGSGNLNLTGTGGAGTAGSGTLILSTGQGYSGNVFITGANLQYNPGASLPGTITLNNASTFTLQAVGSNSVFPGNTFIIPAGVTNATISSNVLGNSAGSLITSGDATSVLNINGSFSLGASGVKQFTTGFTGTAHLNTNAQLRFSGTITGVGDGGDTTTFDLATGSSIFSKNAGNISLGAVTGTGALNGPTSYIIGAKNVAADQFDGTITTAGSLTKVGTGNLTLTGVNTYTGGTNVTSGTLIAGNTAAFGGTGGGIVVNGGTLDISTFSPTAGVVTLTAGTIQSTGSIPATPSVLTGSSFALQSGAITAIIGGGAITKTTTGTVTLTGANQQTGQTTITAGILNINGINALGGANYTGTTFNGGTLQFSTNGTVNGSNDISTIGATPEPVTISAGGATIDTNGQTVTFTNAIGNSGTGSLTKAGTGTLTLAAVNTYSGATIVNAGTLQASGAGTFGTGAGNLTVNTGGTVDLNGTNQTVNALTSVPITTGGTIVNNGSTAANLTVGSGNGAGAYGGTITNGGGLGSVGLIKTGTGTETLGGTNTYTGGTTVNAGTLSGRTTSFGSSTITTTTPGNIDYTQSTAGTANNNITGTGTVTVNGNGAGGNGTGGTITYTGVDNASGGTTVSGGRLELSHTGGGALAGPVTAAANGVIGIASNNQLTTGANVTLLVSGALLAEANSEGTGLKGGSMPPTQGAGTLQIGDATTAATATLDFGDASGTANSGLGNVLAFADSSGLTWNGTLNILNYTGTVDQLYVGTTATGLTPAQLSKISFNGVFNATQLGNGEVVMAAAPEPSGWASMVVGLGVLGVVIARKRRKTAMAA